MQRTFYLLLSGDIIRDIITYPYDGYVETELEFPLPVGINAGYYRLQDGVPVLDQALKDEVDKASRPADYVELERRLAASEAETSLLKAQNKALSDRADFTDDVIAEMALDLYK